MTTKKLRLLALLVTLAASQSGCITTKSVVSSEFERQISAQGFVAYVPPSGNPLNNNLDWRKFGPGAVVRKGRPEPVYHATHLIGDEGIAEARLPGNQARLELFDNTTVKDINLSAGGGFAAAAFAIKIAANLEQATAVDIRFGETWESAPLDEATLGSKLRSKSQIFNLHREDLRKDHLHLVKSAIYTSTMEFRFMQKTGSGASVEVEVPAVQAAEIAAKVGNAKVVNGRVVIESPRFIGYRPLPDLKRYLPRHQARTAAAPINPGLAHQ